MSELLIKLFIKDSGMIDDPKVRGKYGALAGGVGIACNLLLFTAKLIIGTLSGSVSITADAINNLSDASSSVMTLLGFYIAKKPADDEHPFGHARVEYLTGLGVAALILIIGVQLGKDSIDRIINPRSVEFSFVLVGVLVFSIGVKLWLAHFYRRIGRKIGSTTIEATAADSRNDVISTSAVLLAAVIAKLSGVELDGYIGVVVALFILYSGFGIAKETIKPLLGESVDEEMARMISKETLSFDPRILGIHDLMVHDYGPGQRFASVHAEVDSRNDALVMHEVLDNIERMFKEKHNIHMVIHYDPIVTNDAEVNEVRAFVEEKLHDIDPEITLHDFRMVRGNDHTNLIFDMVVPNDMRGEEKNIKLRLDESLTHEGNGVKYYTVITYDTGGFNK